MSNVSVYAAYPSPAPPVKMPRSYSPGDRFTNDLSAKKFVSSFLRTVCVSQTPSTYEILKDFAKIFLNIVVTLRQGEAILSFRKFRKYGRLHLSQPAYGTKFAYYSVKTYYLSTKLSEGIYFR